MQLLSTRSITVKSEFAKNAEKLNRITVFDLRNALCWDCFNLARRTRYAIPERHAEAIAKRRIYAARKDVIARRAILRSRPEAKLRACEAVRVYKSKPHVREKIKRQRVIHEARLDVRSRIVFRSAELRAKKKGLEFSLTPEWVAARVASGVCELTGLQFELEQRQTAWTYNPFSPSVDRISSELGYSPDNCRVVLTAVNLALNQWGLDVLIRIAKALLHKEFVSTFAVRRHGRRKFVNDESCIRHA